jgi:hypothetical protein
MATIVLAQTRISDLMPAIGVLPKAVHSRSCYLFKQEIDARRKTMCHYRNLFIVEHNQSRQYVTSRSSGRSIGRSYSWVADLFSRHQDFRILVTFRDPYLSMTLSCTSTRTKKRLCRPCLVWPDLLIGPPFYRGTCEGGESLTSIGWLSRQLTAECCRNGFSNCRNWRLLALNKEAEGSDGESEIPATSDEFLRKVSSESYTNLSKQMQEKEEAGFEGQYSQLYILTRWGKWQDFLCNQQHCFQLVCF